MGPERFFHGFRQAETAFVTITSTPVPAVSGTAVSPIDTGSETRALLIARITSKILSFGTASRVLTGSPRQREWST